MRTVPTLARPLLLAAALAACARPPPAEPAPEPVAAAAAPEPVITEARARLERGETLADVVDRAELAAAERKALWDALVGAVDARRLRPGQALVTWRDEAGALVKAAWEAGPLEVVELSRDGDAFVAARRPVQLETVEAAVSVRIDQSLWAAFEAAGEDPSLAILASDVLAYELDFYRDVRAGDRMDLVVRKVTSEGRFVRYGELLAVRYTGAAGSRTFYRLGEGAGAGYYDAQGRSVRRAFLKQPLPLVRITSRFGRRVHPTLGDVRKHQGVDYGAPTGTPVWAVGDGVVTWAGPKGANGNLVSIRHANGYLSHYAHLSRLGPGVRVGTRVAQKQVVGRVGSTGRSTGPHLHFALSRQGRFVNPLGLKFPAGEPLATARRAELDSLVATLAPRLAGGPLVASATP
jgi:murein DD-endopeptidase MepM/ murein hydrolase activator NlpD